jgi:tRNA pseudouridine38-40 synthase
MTRYRGTLAYDGTAYQGFQRQAHGVLTVQGVLEDALLTLTGTPTTVIGAGRTDAGVHASGQVIAFDATWRHGTEALLRALNANLPPDIALRDLAGAPPDFHPRFDALARGYCYTLLTTPVRDPLLRDRAWQIAGELDEHALQQASGLLVGTHDFAGFGTPMRPGETTQRVVTRSEWAQRPGGLANETVWTYHVEANAFLRHMVRRMVGALVTVGRGHQPPEWIGALLDSAVIPSGLTAAPPQGLNLVYVRYPAGETPAEALTGNLS